jgi:hypothetical protein
MLDKKSFLEAPTLLFYTVEKHREEVSYALASGLRERHTFFHIKKKERRPKY